THAGVGYRDTQSRDQSRACESCAQGAARCGRRARRSHHAGGFRHDDRERDRPLETRDRTGTDETGVRMDTNTLRVALIGYGEVGGIFGAALAGKVAAVSAYDIRPTDAMRDRARRDGVRLCASAAEAVDNSGLVISAVTASATREAAQSIADAIRRGAHVLDINSASPRVKIECGAIVDAAGGRYVESAVMTSVPPYGIAVPMLLGGTHAEPLVPTLTALGFKA